ncbi:MAG: kelch repeat-containing protein [Elusimicrobiota bacterium]
MLLRHMRLGAFLSLPILACVFSAPALGQTTARYGHTTTLLTDGNVLVAGGANSADTPMTTVEIYISTRPGFVAGRPMSVARTSHTATLLPDGRVLVTGGFNTGCNNDVCSDAEIYDPETNTWVGAGNTMDQPRRAHTATLLPDGKVLITGGETNALTGATTADCDLFDPSTNQFESGGASCGSGGAMILGRAGHTATLLHNGRVFVAGGYTGTDFAVTTEMFDPDADRWTAGPALIQKRAFHSATQMGNQQVLIAGGFNDRNVKLNQGILDTAEIYDPISDSMTPADSLQARKMFHSAVLAPEGRVNFYGGLGNITTSYISGPLVFPSGSLASTPTSDTTGDIDVLNSIVTIDLVGELSAAVTGRIVDGDIFFSSPTATLPDAKILFDNPGISASLDGVLISEPGQLDDTLRLETVPGRIEFQPQEVVSESVVTTAGSLSFTPNPVGASSTSLITSGNLSGTIVVQFPPTNIGGSITSGIATIKGGNISKASSDASAGFDIELTGGQASITGGGPIVSDGLGGATLSMPVTFSNVTGAITNSTTTPQNSPIDVGGLLATDLELALFYVVSPVNLDEIEFDFDVASISIRQMVFSDMEQYDPSQDAWSFGPHGPPLFNHSAVLLPNGDQMMPGGRSCDSASDYSAFNFTAKSGVLVYIYLGPEGTAGRQTAGLSRKRSNHTSTLLPDGRILVAGGSDGVQVRPESELFDAAAETWSDSGIMKLARSHHSATLLPNGTVLAAGGFTSAASTGTTNRAETYFPDTGAWVPTSPMSSSRSYHAAVLLPDGNILVAGGITEGNYLNSAEIYVSTARRWVSIPSMDTKRAQHTASIMQDGRVLVVGGVNGTGVLGQESSTGKVGAEIFDPVTLQWSTAGTLNTRRHSHTATLLRDGRVLVAGGNDGFGEIGKAEIYYPALNAWARTKEDIGGNDMLVPRLNHTATLLPDGKVLFVGGFEAFGGAIQIAEGFDVDFATWQFQGQGAVARGDHTTVLLPDGHLVSIGGYTGVDYLDTTTSLYFAGEPDAMSPPSAIRRRPAITGTDTNIFLPGAAVSVRGTSFKGVTEASGGGAGSANSSHAHPRVYLQRIDGSGNSSANDSGFLLDLTSGAYTSGVNSWSQMGTSITFSVPATSAALPFGWYHLRVAANAQFSESKIVQVGPAKPTGVPGIPEGVLLGVSSISWTWPAAAGIFDGYNVYSATDGVFISTVVPGGGGTQTFIQSGLGPDTSSMIRVAAYNVSGDGEVSVATVPIHTYSSVIASLQGQAQNETEIFWSWPASQAANSYKVYSASSGVVISTVTSNSFLQTGLSTNTASAVQVQAVTEAGDGLLTGAVTTFTLAAPPTPGVPPLQKVSTGGFVAVWFANTNPIGTLYEISVSAEGSTEPVVVSNLVGESIAITGDHGTPPNTRFDVSVAATNGDDISTAYTSLSSTVTLARPPTNPTITVAEPSAIGVAWDANDNPSSTTYKVVYSSDNFATAFSTHISFADAFTGLATTIPNLFTGKTYSIRISAANQYGTETASVSTQAFTDNGGGPAGSLSVLVERARMSVLNGTLSSGRRVTMRVIPETFDSDTRIFISTESALPCGNINAAITITPLPSVQPLIPFELGLEYFPGETNLGSLSTLAIVRYDPVSNSCVPLDSTVDTASNLVLTQVNHLSQFQLQQIAPHGSLSAARVFPNPLYTRTQGYFTFDRMPSGARVRVYTVHGEEVFDRNANASGLLTWNATNQVGRPVASGLYIAVVQSGDTTNTVKLAVVR